jgi:hypothetical protein
MRNGETQAEGGENADLIAGKRENMKNLIGVMTKLLIPKPQVTLSHRSCFGHGQHVLA